MAGQFSKQLEHVGHVEHAKKLDTEGTPNILAHSDCKHVWLVIHKTALVSAFN